MINKITITLISLLFIVSCASTGKINNAIAEKNAESLLCGEGTWGIFLPDDSGNPAPNIKLMNLQYWSDEDKCGRNITMAEIMEINKDVKPAAAKAFSGCKASFEVMVRFTLTPDRAPTVEMQYKDAGPSELPYLESFLGQLQRLTNYRAKKETTYIVFHYAIN